MNYNFSVAILLTTYNGEEFLKQQLDSIFQQEDIGRLSVYACDDGSQDSTLDILKQYPIQVFTTEQLGVNQAIYKLLKCVPLHDYYAFSDQDDVWDRDKVSAAIRKLSSDDEPSLYVGSVRTLRGVKPCKPLQFPEILFRNNAQGCTMVFNNRFRNLIREEPAPTNIIYDWHIVQLALFTSKVHLDCVPKMYYRLHKNNLVGYSSLVTRFLRFFKQFFSKRRLESLCFQIDYLLNSCHGKAEESARLSRFACLQDLSFSERYKLARISITWSIEKFENLGIFFRILFKR